MQTSACAITSWWRKPHERLALDLCVCRDLDNALAAQHFAGKMPLLQAAENAIAQTLKVHSEEAQSPFPI